jgi:hypothetical protein
MFSFRQQSTPHAIMGQVFSCGFTGELFRAPAKACTHESAPDGDVAFPPRFKDAAAGCAFRTVGEVIR